jgi:hypothetical protein
MTGFITQIYWLLKKSHTCGLCGRSVKLWKIIKPSSNQEEQDLISSLGLQFDFSWKRREQEEVDEELRGWKEFLETARYCKSCDDIFCIKCSRKRHGSSVEFCPKCGKRTSIVKVGKHPSWIWRSQIQRPQHIGKCQFRRYQNQALRCIEPGKKSGPQCSFRGSILLDCAVYPMLLRKQEERQSIEIIMTKLGKKAFMDRLEVIKKTYGLETDPQRVLLAEEQAKGKLKRDYRHSEECPLNRSKKGDYEGWDLVSMSPLGSHGQFVKAYFAACHACKNFKGECYGK